MVTSQTVTKRMSTPHPLPGYSGSLPVFSRLLSGDIFCRHSTCRPHRQSAKTTRIINSKWSLAARYRVSSEFDSNLNRRPGQIMSVLQTPTFHANSRLSTPSSLRQILSVFDRSTRAENSHANSRLSTLINSYATLVLV